MSSGADGSRGRDLFVSLTLPLLLLALALARLATAGAATQWRDWAVAVVAVGLTLPALTWSIARHRRRVIGRVGLGHAFAAGCMVPDLGRDSRWALTADTGIAQLWELRNSPRLVRTWTGTPVPIQRTSVNLVTRRLPGLVIGDGPTAAEVVFSSRSQLRWAGEAQRDHAATRLAQATLGPPVD